MARAVCAILCTGAGLLKTARYGSWRSPITSSLIAEHSIALGEVRTDGADIYWLELRPEEAGRGVVVRKAAAAAGGTDWNPKPFNARSRVHEYGGGAWTVCEGVLYFSDDGDRRLYRMDRGGAATALTPPGAWRYADGVIDRRRKQWIGIREDHGGRGEPVNAVVAVGLDGDESEGRVVAAGHDFYSSPKLSPDGSVLAWLGWDHPNMPWTGTTLHLASLKENGEIRGRPEAIAGGTAESIFQPEWTPDGSYLYFVSDRSGWWNLYRYELARGGTEPVLPMKAEFGQAQWQFGMSCYSFAGASRMVCSYVENGWGKLGMLDARSQKLSVIETPYAEFRSVRCDERRVVFYASAPDQPPSIIELDLGSGERQVLKRATEQAENPEVARCLTKPERIEFTAGGGESAFGLFYPPYHPDYTPEPGEKPPLVVRCHGGPTSEASRALDLRVQYWTSRGIAVMDVNYGGSTGSGREYRERLRGKWGVVDVEDCVAAAEFLEARGRIDGNRAVISGGSAGGYTALVALAHSDFFHGGASHYGVTEPAALARETHKFESHYMEWLIGRYPDEEALYRERSPLEGAGKIAAPVIFFQGEEDGVVPASQTRRMVETLRRQGVTVACFYFAGEQHGFRLAETIRRTVDEELSFYAANVFGMDLTY
jgi:dipeptidyl aminopeptidase/acylaminoacyl peptidase